MGAHTRKIDLKFQCEDTTGCTPCAQYLGALQCIGNKRTYEGLGETVI